MGETNFTIQIDAQGPLELLPGDGHLERQIPMLRGRMSTLIKFVEAQGAGKDEDALYFILGYIRASRFRYAFRRFKIGVAQHLLFPLTLR